MMFADLLTSLVANAKETLSVEQRHALAEQLSEAEAEIRASCAEVAKGDDKPFQWPSEMGGRR